MTLEDYAQSRWKEEHQELLQALMLAGLTEQDACVAVQLDEDIRKGPPGIFDEAALRTRWEVAEREDREALMILDSIAKEEQCTTPSTST
jgi:hypothetical protein